MYVDEIDKEESVLKVLKQIVHSKSTNFMFFDRILTDYLSHGNQMVTKWVEMNNCDSMSK